MLKREIELLLFLAAEELSLKDIAKKLKKDEASVQQALDELIKDYENNDTALTILKRTGNYYIMTVKPSYVEIAKKFTSLRELTKKELSLLALIDSKPGISKSLIAKKLGSTIYSLIKDLVKKGYLREEQKGRTSILYVTDKYKDYIGRG
jgi:segregation and condensation protein B